MAIRRTSVSSLVGAAASLVRSRRTAEPTDANQEETAVAKASSEKKSATKKTTAKKSAAEKPAAKKPTTAKKSAAKKSAAKKPTTAKKSAAKKPTAKKPTTAKKSAAKKPTAKKPTTAKKSAAKKPGTAKKSTTKKSTTKKSTTAKKTARASVAKPSKTTATSLLVREGEDPWTRTELAEVKTQLVAELDRLETEIRDHDRDILVLMSDTGDGAGDDQADAGAKTFEREQEISLANNARALHDQATRALESIEAGTYGRCEACGGAVGKMRLQANPRATLCVPCKTKQERH